MSILSPVSVRSHTHTNAQVYNKCEPRKINLHCSRHKYEQFVPVLFDYFMSYTSFHFQVGDYYIPFPNNIIKGESTKYFTVKCLTNLEPLASSSFRSSGTNLSFMPHPNSTAHQGSNLSCMPQPNSTVHQHNNRMADAPDHTSIGHLHWSISTSNWGPVPKPISEMPQTVKVYSSVLALISGGESANFINLKIHIM